MSDQDDRWQIQHPMPGDQCHYGHVRIATHRLVFIARCVQLDDANQIVAEHNDRLRVDTDKLSALLVQTEAMLTIQRNKAARWRELNQNARTRVILNRTTTIAEIVSVTDEIALLENVVQQLRAAGVISK